MTWLFIDSTQGKKLAAVSDCFKYGQLNYVINL